MIDGLDWTGIAAQLSAEGYALVPGLLGPDAARRLARETPTTEAGHRLPQASNGPWRGGLHYSFDACLSPPWGVWRTAFYCHLATIANRWNEILGISDRYPAELDDFLQRNRQAGQFQPQSHVSRLGVEDYVALHQRSDGEYVFPFQVVALLSEPGTDFRGGEFVMTEQRPRTQSRPIVLPLKLGDAAIISTSVRPFQGTKGYYRVNLKHAVSRVHRGERVGVELSFHNAR
jgi:hypothetical protein